jgi:hypothetical protein
MKIYGKALHFLIAFKVCNKAYRSGNKVMVSFKFCKIYVSFIPFGNQKVFIPNAKCFSKNKIDVVDWNEYKKPKTVGEESDIEILNF